MKCSIDRDDTSRIQTNKRNDWSEITLDKRTKQKEKSEWDAGEQGQSLLKKANCNQRGLERVEF